MSTTATSKSSDQSHLSVLDGWRGISIIFVLAGHLLPLSPKQWEMNGAVATSGMAIFFTLSGFLIARFLIAETSIRDFLIRRFCRIVPLSWAYFVLTLSLVGVSWDVFASHMLFYANLPPSTLIPVTGHMWSLCVEVQFYVAIAAFTAIAGRKSLRLIPLICLAVTALRIYNGAHVSIYTYERIDEILAGASLAVLYSSTASRQVSAKAAHLLPVLFIALLVSSHPLSGWMNYARPYFAAATVGLTLYAVTNLQKAVLCSRPLRYVAQISYALYVIHPLLAHSWLGTGDTLVKYAKRPLLFLVLWAASHISTFYFEKTWTDWGRNLTKRRRDVTTKS